MELIEKFESLPLVAKIIILIIPVLGGWVCFLYRILKYLANKNTGTLIFGILGFIPLIGTISQIIDIVTEVTTGRITFMAD